MKNTEIITMSTINIDNRVFKDDRLAKATQRIRAIYNDAYKYADSKNREIAKILGDIAEKKSYEKDGFKSVADYASSVFGIATQNAYALARAGKVYNDDKAHPELKAMSPSKIAELATVDSSKLAKALDDGKITHNTTQKELREFADKTKQEKENIKPEVLDTFTARPYVSIISDEQAESFSIPRTMDEWDDWFITTVSSASPETPVEIVKLPKGKVNEEAKKATVNRVLYFNRGFSIIVEFYKYVSEKSKSTKPKVQKFTKEELQAMLSELEASEKESN